MVRKTNIKLYLIDNFQFLLITSDNATPFTTIEEKMLMKEFVVKGEAFADIGEAVQIHSNIMGVLNGKCHDGSHDLWF